MVWGHWLPLWLSFFNTRPHFLRHKFPSLPPRESTLFRTLELQDVAALRALLASGVNLTLALYTPSSSSLLRPPTQGLPHEILNLKCLRTLHQVGFRLKTQPKKEKEGEGYLEEYVFLLQTNRWREIRFLLAQGYRPHTSLIQQVLTRTQHPHFPAKTELSPPPVPHSNSVQRARSKAAQYEFESLYQLLHAPFPLDFNKTEPVYCDSDSRQILSKFGFKQVLSGWEKGWH